MSDGGIPPPVDCSRVWLKDVVWAIGETARPVGMGMVLTGTTVGFILGFFYKLDPTIFGVMATLAGTLYGAKAVETYQKAKVEAQKTGV